VYQILNKKNKTVSTVDEYLDQRIIIFTRSLKSQESGANLMHVNKTLLS
jgi:hypothetical protein